MLNKHQAKLETSSDHKTKDRNVHITVINSQVKKYLNIVSASTSPNQTLSIGEKSSPDNSNIATSPPPFN